MHDVSDSQNEDKQAWKTELNNVDGRGTGIKRTGMLGLADV
jgi:hypothetical protein